MQNEEIKDKAKKTSLLKYGCENLSSSEEVKEKIRSAWSEKSEEESKKTTKRSLKESHKYNNSISLYDNLYNCSPTDDFLADLLDFAETYGQDYNKKIDELIDINCGEWFDYVTKAK